MMCLVGPYGLSGSRPRSTKYSSRVSGKIIGGFQLVRRAVIIVSKKVCIDVLKDDFSSSFGISVIVFKDDTNDHRLS